MAAAFRAKAEHLRPRSDCPRPERIWEAVRLQASLDERLEVIDHLSGCPACAEAWRLANQLAAADTQTAQPKVNAFERTQLTLRVPSAQLSASYRSNALAIGTAAVLVIALGIPFTMLRRGATPTENVAERQPSERPVAALSERDLRLRWTPGPAGSHYDVTVMTPNKEVVAEARNLEVTEYRVPPERLARLADEALLWWRVAAHTPEGLSVSSGVLPVGLEGQARPATLAAEPDETAIRTLIAGYEKFLETSDLPRLRSDLPNATPAHLGDRDSELRLDDVQDVSIEVLNLQFEGNTADARIRRRDTVRINTQHQVRTYAQILRFERTGPADQWRMTADPPIAIDK
jgi:hypothetical protein